MKRRSFILDSSKVFLGSGLFLQACKNPISSDPKLLTNRDLRCNFDQQRAQEILNLISSPSKHSRLSALGYQNNQHLAQSLAMLPKNLFDFLLKMHEKTGFQVRLSPNHVRYEGLCEMATYKPMVFDPYRPQLVTDDFDVIVQGIELKQRAIPKMHIAVHEFAHAIEHFVQARAYQAKIPYTVENLQRTYSAVLRSREARYIRSYSKSNFAEFWADAFSHYLCGDTARQWMEQYTPTTFAFLDPLMRLVEDEGTSGAGQPSAKSPPENRGGNDPKKPSIEELLNAQFANNLYQPSPQSGAIQFFFSEKENKKFQIIRPNWGLAEFNDQSWVEILPQGEVDRKRLELSFVTQDKEFKLLHSEFDQDRLHGNHLTAFLNYGQLEDKVPPETDGVLALKHRGEIVAVQKQHITDRHIDANLPNPAANCTKQCGPEDS